MAENIEFKAKIEDFDTTYLNVSEITKADPTVLYQKDIFYRTRFGRLKLRSICNEEYELIFYVRPNHKGPKCSRYLRFHVKHETLTDRILSKIFGRLVIVKKQRNLFLLNNIRFHLDKVADLGTFLEIEYVLSPSESRDIAQKRVNHFIRALHITNTSLIEKSYAELMLQSE